MPPDIPHKRKREIEVEPPRVRDVVDEETGQIIRVRIDDSKSAKRRHQKNGGGWRPTAGQIKAADIWNEQEEKIKRDKEREERKRRNAARQAEKDARLKEIQLERLQKGKITIEDTWGKVSASQNRLNKFFRAPRRPIETSSHIGASSTGKEPTKMSTSDDQGQVQDSENNPVCSVLEDKLPRRTNFDMLPPTLPSIQSRKSVVRSPPVVIQGAVSRDSRNSMPPPPPPVKVHQRIQPVAPEPQSPLDTEADSAASRTPLAQLSPVQVSIRTKEHSSPEATVKRPLATQLISPVPLSTQIVTETLAGLSSQDLEEDWIEDKENHCPSMSPKSAETAQQPPVPTSHGEVQGLSGSDSSEDFDDADIDDDTLVSLVATQKMKDQFWQSARYKSTSLSTVSTIVDGETPPVAEAKSSPSPQDVRLATESFAFTDVDDTDLLQCMEEFENETNGDDVSDEDLLYCVQRIEASMEGTPNLSSRKRRILPWVKHPVQMSFREPD